MSPKQKKVSSRKKGKKVVKVFDLKNYITMTDDPSVKVIGQTMRFENTSSMNGTAITSNNLILAALGVATSTTNLTAVFYSFRIRRIRFWGPANNPTSTNNIQFEWATQAGSNFAAPSRAITCGSLGTAYGSFLQIKPASDQIWSGWFNSLSSQNAFYIGGPAHSTIEIKFDAIAENNDATINVAVVGAAATHNYRIGLDGLPTASTNLPPVGFATI